jgi:hypothetical protein
LEPGGRGRRLSGTMPSKPTRPPHRQPEPILSTGPGARMTPAQRTLLRRLAQEAYEPDAFSEQLTQVEAAERIAMLNAKLKLLDEPPHTL